MTAWIVCDNDCIKYGSVTHRFLNSGRRTPSHTINPSVNCIDLQSRNQRLQKRYEVRPGGFI